MRFDIITVFPQIIEAYLNESIIKRARERGLLDVRVHNLRDFTEDKHHKVDDRPFGGGPGMVLQLTPIIRAIEHITKNQTRKKKQAGIMNYELRIKDTLIVLLSAGGKQFDSKQAIRFSKKYKQIILIAGRYEGVDSRLKSIIHNSGFLIHEISVGNFVLTGGELPALVVLDAVSRHIPGVLGKEESLEEKRYGVGVPVYTRPEVFEYKGKKYKIPRVLKSGDHKKIEEWRKKKHG